MLQYIESMDTFKKLDTSMYACFTVSGSTWNGKNFILHGTVVFDNEDDAKKCLEILDLYKETFYFRRTSNVMNKTMFTFDGTTIHLLSGAKIEYDQNAARLKKIVEIEKTYTANAWEYMDPILIMDDYVRLFGYLPLRKRAFWSCLLLCFSCSFIFCIDPCYYEAKYHRQL
jgi:hypothetical protein